MPTTTARAAQRIANNPTPNAGPIETTNPCGEQPLLPYESCTLGSVNLVKMISGSEVDWDRLGRTVELAVRFLDNVVDLTSYPTEEIRERSRGNRKIGLGAMGFADALILLGMRYDSDAALGFASGISGFIQEQAHQASARPLVPGGAGCGVGSGSLAGRDETIRTPTSRAR